jgi:hypothetical protein
MPRIRPYESQVGSQGDVPSRNAGLQDFGGAGLSNLGQGIENAGQSVGQAARIINHAKAQQEVTDEHVAHIASVSRLTAQIAEHEKTYIAVDPETGKRNPTLSERMPDLIKSELDKRGVTADGGSAYETQPGQNAFNVNAAELSRQFVDVARHADAKLAGEAVANTMNETTDNLWAHVFAHPVPATVEWAMAQARKIVSVFPEIGTGHQQKLLRVAQEKIASRAVEGAIRQYPNRALAMMRQPPEARDAQYDFVSKYIPNEKLNTLLSRAETEVRAGEIEARQAQAEFRRQQKDTSDAIETSLMEQHGLHLVDAKNPSLKPLDVVKAMQGGLDGSTGRTLLNMIDEEARRGPRPVHTNPVVEHTLFSRIHLPDGDPKKITETGPIYEAFLGGHLSATTRDNLRRELVEARSPDGSVFGREKADFLKGIEPQITKPGPFGVYADPSTPEQFSRFKRDLEASITAYRKQGKDPRMLFDPNSSDYFGKKARQYTVPGFGSLQPAPIPSATPRKSLDEIFGKQP